MKKWIFGIVVLILLVYGLNVIQQPGETEGKAAKPPANAPNQQQPEADFTSLTIDREDIYRGDLLLINLQYPVSEQTEVPDVVNLFEHQELVKGFGILDQDIKLPMEMLEWFTDMMESAMADGVNHFLINSGYRDNEEQALLYEQLGSVYAKPPGYSEHNLGLSLDLGSSLGLMKDAPEGKWLQENAWKHGFVLRYPENKTEVTGVIYEPWHFRYVGLPHSAIMQERGMVLEEYLTYLKVQKRVQTVVDGKAYEVSYYPVRSAAKLSVPIKGNYSLSGNNMDGVILTTWDTGSPSDREAGSR
ncbi:M15 family metallopeptidase [Paenibacillus sp. LHD-117]|uniref:M15 family metallopeptidase n=1 Tax=Paenibacillus sp. LHD-117 TaxID=3071412 RepID=UPI0027E172AE|nr:M15 family metallopeptidase [Paenibacillus sp. LHD-117]MDQ6423471.1 M15 family metallopeptidase [Paenibacillus sp. LHD-117]